MYKTPLLKPVLICCRKCGNDLTNGFENTEILEFLKDKPLLEPIKCSKCGELYQVLDLVGTIAAIENATWACTDDDE